MQTNTETGESTASWDAGPFAPMERGYSEKPHERPLGKRLAGAMEYIENLKANRQNEHDGYKYADAHQQSNSIRQAFAKTGVAMYVSMMGWQQDSIQTRDGKPQQIHTARFDIRLENGDDPRDYLVLHWCCEAIDRGDKGLSKCVTAAMKDCLRASLSIGGDRGDDYESESPEKSQAPRQSRYQPRQAPAPRSEREPTRPAPPAHHEPEYVEEDMPALGENELLGDAFGAWTERALKGRGKSKADLIAAITRRGKPEQMNGSAEIAKWSAQLADGIAQWLRRSDAPSRTDQAKALVNGN